MMKPRLNIVFGVLLLVRASFVFGVEPADQATHRPSAASAIGNATTQEDLKNFSLLVNLKTRKLEKTAAADVKEGRIYLRWEKDFDRSAIPAERGSWVLSVAGFGAKFYPGDVLLPGSIVPGEWLGEEPGSRWVYRENVKSHFDRWVQLQGKPVAEYYISSYPANDDGTERSKREVHTFVYGLKDIR